MTIKFENMKQYLYILFLLPFISFSQDFSNEDYIFIKRHEFINIELNKGKFNITKNVSEQAEFLTAKNLYYANESLSYSGLFTSIENINAYTFLPEKNKKVEVDYTEVQRGFDNTVFYDDQEAISFIFPAVTKGAITNLDYTEVMKDHRFIGLFNFGSFVPTKDAKLSISFPKNVEIGYVEYNTDHVNIDFEKTTKKNKNIYTWTVKNVESYKMEDNSESPMYYIPHIIPFIKSYSYKGKTHNVLRDVTDLYKWYTTFNDQVDTSNLDNVYKIAEDITKDLNTEEEKTEAIFNWVQDKITYVAFEDGMGGFIARGAASVCDKRYGDCKDMSNLLYEMLNHVGIKSYRTWIGSRSKPYKYTDLPSPLVDNHVITAAIVENDTIYLDATDSYVPYGMPSSFTQNKQALISIDKHNFKVTKVPVQEADKSISQVNTTMTLNGSSLTAKETRALTGYEKVDFIDKYRVNKDDISEEEFLNVTLALGNNKTKYTNIDINNFNNKREALNISYDLQIDNYAKTVANKTYINLNIDRVLAKSKIDIDNRKYSKKIENKFKRNYTTTFTLPKGYKIVSIPKDLSFSHEHYGFDISYTKKDNTIIQHKTVYINTLSINKNEFESWNSFIKSLIKAYKKSITIEKSI